MLLDAAKIQNNRYLKNFSLKKYTELYTISPHLHFINSKNIHVYKKIHIFADENVITNLNI